MEPAGFFARTSPEALIDAAPVGMVSLDGDGRFLAVNGTALRWLGYGDEELLGLPAAEVLSLDSLPAFKAAFETLKKTGEAMDLEVRLIRKDGSRFPGLFSATALRGDGGKLLQCLGVVYDLTHRKDKEQRESERSRAANQRDFVANVSHEFRTPLAAIIGFTETLQEGAIDNPSLGGKFLATIERHAHRLLGLVDNVLDISERDAGRKAPNLERVELGPELRRIARGLAPVAKERGVKIRTSVRKGLYTQADRAQLEQVLSNLIGNAIKYNKKGGTVRVEAKELDHEGVELIVSDTGIGIAEDELPYLFDRFHRSKDPAARERKGTGLGLAISRGIVRAHGGRIWAESRPGKGSAFHVTLPR
jgi:two-component system sensor histidine kinase VicK